MKILKCPRCGSDNFDIISGTILKCKACGVVFDLTEDIMQSPEEEEDDPDFEEVKLKKEKDAKYPTIADYTRMPLLLKRQRKQEEVTEELGEEPDSHPNPLHLKPGNAQICPNCENMIPKGNEYCPLCHAKTDLWHKHLRITLIITGVLIFFMIMAGIQLA